MWHPESIFDASGHLDEGVVHAWLDGQLAPDAATNVEEHAAGCATCSAMVAEARGLVAGASRVLSSLDEPAAGHAPARDAMLGIVAAAGKASASRDAAPAGAAAGSRSRPDVRRWSTRRVSLLAAAGLVFVTGTLVLRESGSVREMVQVDQRVLGDSAATGAPGTAPEAAPGAPVVEPATGAAEAEGSGTRESGVANEPRRLMERPESPATARSPVSAGSVGAASGAARSAGEAVAGAFRSPAPPVAQRKAVPEQPPSAAAAAAAAAAAPPAPTPAAAAPQAELGGTTVVTRAGVAGGVARDASDEAVRAREIAVARDAASRAIRPEAADERRQLQATEMRASQGLGAEQREGNVRTSAEIQAMVRMVSTCWRIAGSDSLIEMLPPASGGAVSGAPGGSALWIPGWLRIGRDATNPDRVWWLPLADSASARVRLDDAVSPDLVITPRQDSARVWRIARSDSLSTWASIPRTDAAGSAASVRCP